MNTSDTAVHEMIEAGGRTAQSFGFNRILGQIYVALFLSPQPASLDEIAQKMGVSKASASIACRQLEAWGTLRRTWKKGDRKDYYEAITDIPAILNNGLLLSLNKKLTSGASQIQRSLELLQQTEGDPREQQFVRQQLEKAEKYRRRLEKMINNPLVRKLI